MITPKDLYTHVGHGGFTRQASYGGQVFYENNPTDVILGADHFRVTCACGASWTFATTPGALSVVPEESGRLTLADRIFRRKGR